MINWIRSTSRAHLLYAVIVLAAIFVIGGAFYLDKLELKDLGTGFLALLGTLLGATLAFRLNEEKESKKEQAARRSALNRVLFVLARQRNAASLIAKQLAPYTTPFDRAFSFPAAKVPAYADLVQRFDELEFLLGTADVNVVMRLTVEQERFQQMLESLRTRNEFHVRDLQPEIARLGLNGRNISRNAVAALLGERVFGTAMSTAGVLFDHVESSLKTITEMHDEIREVAKRLYPDSKFIGFAPPDASPVLPSDPSRV